MKNLILLGFLAFGVSFFAKAQQYSWEKPQAKVIETGDLQWQPEPFKYIHGSAVRYIDFEAGDDNNDGKTKSTPWKHHPWDANATGNAKDASGIITYVFKRGVVYRGVLDAKESGEPGNPIRLLPIPPGEREKLIFTAQGDLLQDGKKLMLRVHLIFLIPKKSGTGILTEKCLIPRLYVN